MESNCDFGNHQGLRVILEVSSSMCKGVYCCMYGKKISFLREGQRKNRDVWKLKFGICANKPLSEDWTRK